MGREERLAQIEAADDRACLSYGSQRGTDAYVACRSQLAGARSTASAIRGAPAPGCRQYLNISICD